MSRRRRVLFLSAAGLILLLALVLATGVFIFRSPWFSEKVRERVVAEAGRATNGRVEIGAFKFDWLTLTAEIDDLAIHGTEPAGNAPLLSAKRILIGLKIISLAERTFNVARIDADSPRAHLIVQPNGDTNIPQPHNITPQKILDLKIGAFQFANGVLLAEMPGSPPKTIPWSARGQNFEGRAKYDTAGARYDGDLSMAPAHLEWDGLGPVDARITATLGLQKNRFTLSRVTAKTKDSSIELSDVAVNNFAAPVATAKYRGALALGEMDRIFKLVNFQHSGIVAVSGEARFASVRDYLVSGSFHGTGLTYGKVRNLSANGRFAADPGEVLLSGLRVDGLGGNVAAAGQIRDLRTVHLTGNFEHFDARELLSLGEMPRLPYDGLLSGPFEATATLSERDFHGLAATGTISVAPARGTVPVHGELDAKYDAVANTLEFGRSWLALPHSRVDFSGVLGRQLAVLLQSADLNELRAAIPIPDSLRAGPAAFSALFEGTVAGSLTDPRLAGRITIRNAIYDQQSVDSAAGDFTADHSGATVNNTVLSSGGLQARVSGSFGFSQWKVSDASTLNATVQISSGQITPLLALLHLKDVPVTGTIDATAKITGTVADPHATADLALAKGQIYGEPYDALTGHAQYLNNGTQLFTGTIAAGTKRVDASGRLDSRKLTFNVSSNNLALDQLTFLRKREPDLRGTARIKADGAIEISPGWKHVKVLDLNADLAATALALGSRSFGDAHFTAATRNGIMTARVTSNAVGAGLEGEGTMSLAGDYPVNGKLTFSNLKLNNDNFEAVIAGQVVVSGPASKPDLITATLDATDFELRPLAIAGQAEHIQKLVLRNDGPVRMTLARSVIHVETARLRGPDTNLELLGQIALNQASPLDLRLQGTVGLTLAQTFSADVTSAGQVAVDADIRGAWTSPLFDGRAELRKGEFHYNNFSNGLTNIDAVMMFSGSRLNIQSFTAESGGGKVDATGFATLTGGSVAFRLEAKARAVRIRYPEGVSSLSDADLTLAGSSERSEVSGTVILRRIAINPKSDAASILASATEPIRTPAARAGLAANMNLDIQIETSPDVAFETSVAQGVQADASLRLRGTLTNPALLGRINFTQGEIVFFGNKYTLNQGSISFFNPAKIDPVLNISLETRARGVDVILTIGGPIAKLNVSYRSDPPLQFGDIVALLATGRAPDNAALIAAGSRTSGFQQLGASALIDQAVANAGSNGRLQRFFGVSRIKIDPQLIGITGSPEARLTIEQQVTQQILFTYVSDVANTSTQLIRVEWDFDPHLAAILTREENGYVGLDFAWKKRFR